MVQTNPKSRKTYFQLSTQQESKEKIVLRFCLGPFRMMSGVVTTSISSKVYDQSNGRFGHET
jgi:hypothetical protein